MLADRRGRRIRFRARDSGPELARARGVTWRRRAPKRAPHTPSQCVAARPPRGRRELATALADSAGAAARAGPGGRGPRVRSSSPSLRESLRYLKRVRSSFWGPAINHNTDSCTRGSVTQRDTARGASPPAAQPRLILNLEHGSDQVGDAPPEARAHGARSDALRAADPARIAVGTGGGLQGEKAS